MDIVETTTTTTTTPAASAKKRAYLMVNILLLVAGGCGAPLIMRLYFIHGGRRIWFSTWLQTAAWPILLLPLLSRRRRGTTTLLLISRSPGVLAAASAIGALIGLADYSYAYGISRLPVSTSSLILASQLAFTAAFAFLIVRQRFTPHLVNAVVLLTVGSAVLGVHAGKDRPEGESKREYLLGFLVTLAAAAVFGFTLPLIELTYKMARRALTFDLAMEIQLVVCFAATVLSTVGMLINHDFQAISGEAKAYELGATKYYLVVVCGAITNQCFFMGMIGVIFYSSSLVSGIIIAVSLPLTEVLAVIFYHEKFQAEKGISLFLCLWGFVSYFYGEYVSNNREDEEIKVVDDDQTREEMAAL